MLSSYFKRTLWLLFIKLLVVEYNNREMDTMDVRRAKPEGDFDPPLPGSIVCVQSKAGNYSATIEEVLDVCKCM